MMMRILGFAAVAALVAGCVTERPTRSYVQPNYLEKDMFKGEWYLRQTVTDVPPTTAITFAGETFQMDKIRWEIQEKWLVGYRSYELIPGSDRHVDPANKGVSATRYAPNEAEGRSEGFKEAPIAAFPIDKHFDIFRQYNSTTGEEVNVLEENDRDNPWYARKYMRVDWSSNQVVNFLMLSNYKAAWYVQDSEKGRDTFRVVRRLAADGKTNEPYYFDFVSKLFVEPDLYGCILSFYNLSTEDCASAEVKVRTSFLRVDGPRDFEPVEYDDLRMSKFGYFRTERMTYNRNRGITQSGRIYLANVHNIWKGSFERDAQGNRIYVDAKSTDGSPVTANQVFYADDVGFHYRDAQGRVVTENGKVKVPTAVFPKFMPKEKRDPKPIVYHLSPNFPQSMIRASELVAESWNVAFRTTVAAAQNRNLDDGSFRSLESCERRYGTSACADNGAGGFCKAGAACEAIPDMYVLHYNGWVKTVAGKQYFDFSPGRDRDHASQTATWAYDTSKEEFQVGDLRYNTIAWIHQNQLAGPLGYGPSAADPETGEIVSGTAYVYGAAVDTYATFALDSVRLLTNQTALDPFVSGQTVSDYIRGNLDRTDPRLKIGADLQALDLRAAKARMLGPKKLAKLEAIRQFGLEPARPGRAQEFMRRVKEHGFDNLLLNDEVRIQKSRGLYTPGAPLTDDEKQRIGLEKWATPDAMLLRTKARWSKALKNNLTLAEFADDAVLGLALEYAQRPATDFADGGAVWQELRDKVYRGVMEHEVGHTIGLRHNFQGSFDSVNYHDQYWQLRSENIVPAGNIRRLSDALNMQRVTRDQVNGKMSEFMYSTVMDYGARFNSDIHGIGKYDIAAIAFAYGNSVQVFNKDRASTDAETAEIIDFTANKPSPIYDAMPEIVHYTQLPFRLGDGDKDLGVQAIRDRTWVSFNQLQALRKQAEVDPSALASVPLEVPYMFCSDDWIGAIGSCQLWDTGADHSEITADIIKRYNNYYFFNNYKRDRHPFYADMVLDRVFGRYLSYLPNMYQHWLFSQFYSSSVDGLGDLYWTISTFDGLNLIGEVLTKPQYGGYELDRDGNNEQIYVHQSYAMSTDGGRVTIPRGDGRRVYSRYDLDSGYYLFDRTLEAGHFWDWLAGLFALMQSEATVLGVETASDFTSYSIPYYLVFEDETTRLMTGIYARDYKAMAPRLDNGTLKNYPAVDINGNNAAPAGVPIDLDLNFTQQIYAQLYSMAFFTASYNLHYADQAQIFRLGNGEAVTPGEGFRLESFTDPSTGHSYGCFVRTTGETNTLAAKLILRAKRLAEQIAQLRAQNPAPDSQAFNTLRNLEYQMNDLVSDVNIIRDLYTVFARLI
jgi:hypothetical protein